MNRKSMKEGQGRILQYGNKFWIYVPYGVAIDSAFPFVKGEQVKIKIVDEKLLVEKVKKEKK